MKVPVLLPNIFDHPFTYTSKEKLKIGDYVEVPFGKKKMIGIIWDDFEEGPKKKFKIKNKSTKFILAGLFQCLAFLPGFSRAGSCIIAFRIFGEDRKYSSIYSLYMGIPIICLSFFSCFPQFICGANAMNKINGASNKLNAKL